MLQNFKSRPRNIKLEKQFGIPSMKMLEEMKTQAAANTGATVELPFEVNALTQSLTVIREKGGWVWMFYFNDGFASNMEWSHVSHDVSSIHTLMGNSHPEFYMSHSPVQQLEKAADKPPPEPRKGTLEGNLRDIQIANLLQSINMGQMTGRLEIVSESDRATIYFSNGDAKYASMRGAEGLEALLQLFIWEQGSFAFYNDSTLSVTANVTRGLTGVIMEGATFADHHTLLKERGLSHQCYPERVLQANSKEQLASLIKESVECDSELQWNIYQKITGNSSWAEIIRDFPCKKTEWVLPMFNMVKAEVIRFNQGSLQSLKPNLVTQTDWSIAQTIRTSMCRLDTGIYTFAALLYWLEHEFCRFEDFELPFSIVVFGFCIKESKTESPPPFVPLRSAAFSDLRNKISAVLKRYDIFCHYGPFGYAILLPLTMKRNACQFVEILAEICVGVEVTDEYGFCQTEFRYAVANIPEDSLSLDEMLAIAEKVRGPEDYQNK